MALARTCRGCDAPNVFDPFFNSVILSNYSVNSEIISCYSVNSATALNQVSAFWFAVQYVSELQSYQYLKYNMRQYFVAFWLPE